MVVVGSGLEWFNFKSEMVWVFSQEKLKKKFILMKSVLSFKLTEDIHIWI